MKPPLRVRDCADCYRRDVAASHSIFGSGGGYTYIVMPDGHCWTPSGTRAGLEKVEAVARAALRGERTR